MKLSKLTKAVSDWFMRDDSGWPTTIVLAVIFAVVGWAALS